LWECYVCCREIMFKNNTGVTCFYVVVCKQDNYERNYLYTNLNMLQVGFSTTPVAVSAIFELPSIVAVTNETVIVGV
jgi:hypothetical protein